MAARRVRSIAWTALLFVLFSSAAPSISRTLAAGKGIQLAWAGVCTAAGIKTSVIPDGPAPPHTPRKTGMADCPYCLAQGCATAPPPSHAGCLPPTHLDEPAPLLTEGLPYRSHTAVAARPRAPPRAS